MIIATMNIREVVCEEEGEVGEVARLGLRPQLGFPRSSGDEVGACG